MRAVRWRVGDAFGQRSRLLVAAAAVAIAVSSGPPPACGQGSAPPWTVFRPADASLPMGDNLVANAGFELGQPDRADGWRNYGGGYLVDDVGGRRGSRAVKLVNPRTGATRGASTVITLDQTEPVPLYFSGWSRAQDVTGVTDSNYSVYLDLRYADGTPLYGQTLRFAVGTHGWQHVQGFILPAKPIASISMYCLLRNSHTGTVWFDDLEVREVQAELLSFDGMPVATAEQSQPPYGGALVEIESNDGLQLQMSTDGGAVTGLDLGDDSVVQRSRSYAGGFLVRDVAAEGDVLHVGGRLERHGGRTLVQESQLDDLGLSFQAAYSGGRDRIEVHAEIVDTSGTDRAVTLYFALPVDATGWAWGDDVRSSSPITGSLELSNMSALAGLGANGYISKYPWAAIAGPQGGLAFGLPLAGPRIMRLVHNPVTDQLYVAFDLGLSPRTSKFVSRAWVDFIIYRFDPEWGFRAATQGYYDRFPSSFVRRVPPDEEGIWVAFSDLSRIPAVDDFGIRFHELGTLGQIEFDEGAGIQSYRYKAEPWSHWLRIDDRDVDPDDYEQTVAYLHERREAGDRRAEATLSSGFHDDSGHLVYQSTVRPWCSGSAGCAVFTVNPDPDITDPEYPISKGAMEWSDADKSTYDRMPGLDGEYIDSYLGAASAMDLRTSHLAAADTPLTFRTSDARIGTPQVFATTEFARWLTTDVHESLGRRTMANGILLDVPWGADLFDVMGRETNWLRTGKFVPDSDARMIYQRTLANQRPYALLMNTDFDNLTHELVERYFQAALFYGVYPSMFSHNAATDRYWDDPALYERDRPLFRRYVPMIRQLNREGWRPETFVNSSDERLIVERFGQWPDLLLTVRNTSESEPVTATLTLDAGRLGLPRAPLTAGASLSGDRIRFDIDDLSLWGTIRLPSQGTEVLHFAGYAIHLPMSVTRRTQPTF